VYPIRSLVAIFVHFAIAAVAAVGFARVVAAVGMAHAVAAVGMTLVVAAVGMALVVAAVGIVHAVAAVSMTLVVAAVGMALVVAAIGMALVVAAVGIALVVTVAGMTLVANVLWHMDVNGAMAALDLDVDLSMSGNMIKSFPASRQGVDSDMSLVERVTVGIRDERKGERNSTVLFFEEKSPVGSDVDFSPFVLVWNIVVGNGVLKLGNANVLALQIA